MIRRLLLTVALAATLCPVVNAQKYRYIDKTVAVVGNEPITLSMIEGEVKNQRARGMASDRSVRCELLETVLESKLLLMQARIDSLSVNNDWVEGRLSQDLDQAMSYFGGEKEPYPNRPFGRKVFGEWSDYTVLSRDALMASTVSDGKIVSPSGIPARFLLIPEYLKSASPDVMRKIESFIFLGGFRMQHRDVAIFLK